MRVLVTGGAGFIGSHLVDALMDAGHEVRVLDNLSSGSRYNLQKLPSEFIEGDVADFEVVKMSVEGCDLIFHQAALVSVPKSIENPALNHDTNVTGTFNVFEAARLANVPRIVYASSAAVYGNAPKLQKSESDHVAPMTPYAMAKYNSELLAAVYAQMYDIQSIGLRYMNVFGPRQDPTSPYSGVLSIFCQRALAGEGVTIYGDGEQTRDFVYVQDVVRANLLGSAHLANCNARADVFNVGGGMQISLNQIIEMLSEIRDYPIEVTYQPARKGDIKHSVADIQHIQKTLGFMPKTAVIDGLKQTLNWYQSI